MHLRNLTKNDKKAINYIANYNIYHNKKGVPKKILQKEYVIQISSDLFK